MSKNKEFNIHDDVKHIKSGTLGTILAIYSGERADLTPRGDLFMDVRTAEDHIVYKTPVLNWELVVKAEDKE